MREEQIDLWEAGAEADAVCITTNGTITGRGLGVLGRGCALEATTRFPKLQRRMGFYLKAYGNHVGVLLPPPPVTLVVFPVKHEWMETASGDLIARSLLELVDLTTRMQWKRVVLPRPGCGNGGLTWDVVKLLCLTALDDRFLVVHK